MIKPILVLLFFAFLVASLKPAPSVKELTEVTKTLCKDICK